MKKRLFKEFLNDIYIILLHFFKNFCYKSNTARFSTSQRLTRVQAVARLAQIWSERAIKPVQLFGNIRLISAKPSRLKIQQLDGVLKVAECVLKKRDLSNDNNK